MLSLGPYEIAFIATSVLLAGFISGVFGMAGGMVLMGALLRVLPVPAAMVLHGVTQMSSNGWRGIVWRRYVNWRIVLRFVAGLILSCIALFSVSYIPNRGIVLLCLGSMPFVVMMVPPTVIPQVDRRFGAEICGALNAVLQIFAGVSGPALDAFFIRTGFDRRVVVATKAVCQMCAHFGKLLYFSHVGRFMSGATLDAWVFALSIGMAIVGTTLSRNVLDRLSDTQFRRWTRAILLGIGLVYLMQSFRFFLG